MMSSMLFYSAFQAKPWIKRVRANQYTAKGFHLSDNHHDFLACNDCSIYRL
jgi:hypothetical protein